MISNRKDRHDILEVYKHVQIPAAFWRRVNVSPGPSMHSFHTAMALSTAFRFIPCLVVVSVLIKWRNCQQQCQGYDVGKAAGVLWHR